MTQIPSDLPAALRSGDTAKWRRVFPEYPASAGWVLAYTIVGANGAHSISASADADAHKVTLTSEESSGWASGQYTLTEYVSKDGERYTLNTRPIQILSDLAGSNGAYDTRSHARKMLDAIEAWLESKAPTAASVEIAGRKISNYPLAELLRLRDKYQFEVRIENNAAAGKRGNKLLVRF